MVTRIKEVLEDIVLIDRMEFMKGRKYEKRLE